MLNTHIPITNITNSWPSLSIYVTICLPTSQIIFKEVQCIRS